MTNEEKELRKRLGNTAEVGGVMDYSTMEAGREMDALVAEKVMGSVPCDAWEIHNTRSWVLGDSCGHSSCYPENSGPPEYSTNISAAWEVVKKIFSMGFEISVSTYSRDEDTLWVCVIGHGMEGCVFPEAASAPEGMMDVPGADAPTAPLAICRAALCAITRDLGISNNA